MATETKNLRGALEALLFVLAEPISYRKLSEILKTDIASLKQEVAGLREDLSLETRGLAISEIGNEIQLTTKPEFSGLLQGVIKSEIASELTPSSLEALSIVAYLGPISRPFIDFIRGVNSSFILRSLLLRGLVQRSEEKRSNAYLYEPSFEFLRHLGVARQEDLPDYEKYQELGKTLKNDSL